jgi:hypothetical protein
MKEIEDHVERNGIQTTLEAYGKDTSIYDIALASSITMDELYINTESDKVYHGTVKDPDTNEKFVIDKSKFRVVIDKDASNPYCQIIALLDGDVIDARGSYARKLKVVSKRR